MIVATLGPVGTNSELAGAHFLNTHGIDGVVDLYDHPNEIIASLIEEKSDRAILCSVYPFLYDLVFKNLNAIKIVSAFTYDTYPMLVASLPGKERYETGCSHPAPIHLLNGFDVNIEKVNSNSAAAQLVSDGKFDLCVTTSDAAARHNLEVVVDFGPVPMAWVVFSRK